MAETFYQSFPATGAIPYASKSHANTGYTLTSNDGLIYWTLTNGSNDTATIPLAASNPGVPFYIKLRASTAGMNTLILGRTGSDTFTLSDGTTAATSIQLQTSGEFYKIVSDGTSVWQVTNHTATTSWAAYTPTGSWSTNTTYTGFWRREADSFHGKVKVSTAGAPTSAALTTTLPFSLTYDASKFFDTSASKSGTVTVEDGGAAKIIGVWAPEGTNIIGAYVGRGDATYVETSAVTQAVPITFGATDNVYIDFIVPITGWTA